jgi:hypothetical protein
MRKPEKSNCQETIHLPQQLLDNQDNQENQENQERNIYKDSLEQISPDDGLLARTRKAMENELNDIHAAREEKRARRFTMVQLLPLAAAFVLIVGAMAIGLWLNFNHDRNLADVGADGDGSAVTGGESHDFEPTAAVTHSNRVPSCAACDDIMYSSWLCSDCVTESASAPCPAPTAVDLSSQQAFLNSIVSYDVGNSTRVGTWERNVSGCEFIGDFAALYFEAGVQLDFDDFSNRYGMTAHSTSGISVYFNLSSNTASTRFFISSSVDSEYAERTVREITREHFDRFVDWFERVIAATDRYCINWECEETLITDETSCLGSRGGWNCRNCCHCEICAVPVDMTSRETFMATAHRYTAKWFYPYDEGDSRTNENGWGFVIHTTDVEHLALFADFFFSLTNTARYPAPRTPSRNCSYGTLSLEVKSEIGGGALFEVFVERGQAYLWYQGYGSNIERHRTHTYEWVDPYVLIREQLSGTYRITAEQYEWFKNWVMPVVELDLDMSPRVG